MIYLVRHGESESNIAQELSCNRIDRSLTPKGCLQAEQTAQYFLDKGIKTIFSSPLRRSIETANSIGNLLKIKPVILKEFQELNAGDLEDDPKSQKSWDIYKEVIHKWISGDLHYSFPSGENFVEAAARFFEGMQQVLSTINNEPSVIVGHGGIFTVGVLGLCKMQNQTEIISKEYHNCAISELDVKREKETLRCSVVCWAEYSHLKGDAKHVVSDIPILK